MDEKIGVPNELNVELVFRVLEHGSRRLLEGFVIGDVGHAG
jgi:hypothetical protein